MRLHSASIAAMLATASALKITQPGQNDIVNVSQDWQVCWDYVDPDPQSFCLYLTNYKFYPPQTFYLRQVTTNWRCSSIPGTCYSNFRSSGYRVRASPCGDPETIFAETADLTAKQPSCPSQ
ncbi:hypothetical protein BJX96DRAFT_179969 [Aspergillus floccosus]